MSNLRWKGIDSPGGGYAQEEVICLRWWQLLYLPWLRQVKKLLTLGIETSCDDTSVALLEGSRNLLRFLVASQLKDHEAYGGVVPELASRKHLENLIPLLSQLLDECHIKNPSREINLIAVTDGPGLMGSLLIGTTAAKALAQAWEVPLMTVNHLEGHIFANYLAHEDLLPPFITLIISGGHTELILVKSFGDYSLLGATRDDAVGEAFDKVARLLGLGYPGGPLIDEMARRGDPFAVALPIPMADSPDIEFSFSGLKTAVLWALKRNPHVRVEDLCASFQYSAIEALLRKVDLAVKITGIDKVAISGGVAANSQLREKVKAKPWRAYIPPKELCTDNAAMIAAAGCNAYRRGERSSLSFMPDPAKTLA